MAQLLVVCTGNICRSPVGEALLAHHLRSSGITLHSAGTHAMVGAPPAPEALAHIRESLDTDFPHRGTQVTKAAAESAGLILTMTEEQRAMVARLAPRSVRRTYTMLEFARVISAVENREKHGSLHELVHACAPKRRRANPPGVVNDIADPYGGTAEGYAESFALVSRASDDIAAGITRRLRASAS
ncbi:hypothetical protein [Brachybacterium vulturis]|uniref:arsenate reductase/protein-tyrosine-phosphatase family protein n=1 Tax=Brachybacterium vulturis TaxID=2017484 RepID=UPI003735C959